MLEIGTKFVGKNGGNSFTEYTVKKCVDAKKEKYVFNVTDVTINMAWTAAKMAHVTSVVRSEEYELIGKFILIPGQYCTTKYIKAGREARRKVYETNKTTDENIDSFTKEFIDDYNWFMLR